MRHQAGSACDRSRGEPPLLPWQVEFERNDFERFDRERERFPVIRNSQIA